LRQRLRERKNVTATRRKSSQNKGTYVEHKKRGKKTSKTHLDGQLGSQVRFGATRTAPTDTQRISVSLTILAEIARCPNDRISAPGI